MRPIRKPPWCLDQFRAQFSPFCCVVWGQDLYLLYLCCPDQKHSTIEVPTPACAYSRDAKANRCLVLRPPLRTINPTQLDSFKPRFNFGFKRGLSVQMILTHSPGFPYVCLEYAFAKDPCKQKNMKTWLGRACIVDMHTHVRNIHVPHVSRMYTRELYVYTYLIIHMYTCACLYIHTYIHTNIHRLVINTHKPNTMKRL